MSDLLNDLLFSQKFSETSSPASPASPQVTRIGEAGEAGDIQAEGLPSSDAKATASLGTIRIITERSEAPSPYPSNQHFKTGLPTIALRRCGSLVCFGCGSHSPTAHREDCLSSRFEPCGSRWFWLSPYRAIKCVRCSTPENLELVEAWVLAVETDDGHRRQIPDEILSQINSRNLLRTDRKR